MDSATFLLAINITIGMAFGLCFVVLAGRAATRRGLWFVAGFLCASGTALAEIAARFGFPPRLASFLSFACLVVALVLIAEGVSRYFTRLVRFRTLVAFAAAACAFKVAVLDSVARDSLVHAVGYQLAFAVPAAVAAASALAAPGRGLAGLATGGVFAAIAVQFLLKAHLAMLMTTGTAVQSYAVSRYAFYSQTAGAILSLLMGLSLLAVVGREVLRDHLTRSETDMLSGLPVRRAFFERAEAAAARPAFAGHLVICDLDRFKAINDTFGHSAGDEVIAAFGRLLRAGTGAAGVCGRLGGEEFAVLLPGAGEAAAIAFVQALRSALQRERYRLLPPDYAVTTSFGLCAVGAQGIAAAMHEADRALYAAKGGGRDTFRLATPI
ncbi:GGDEF domain-containing protein [Pseudoxanthobacter sp.]|uniref:GGDEF domain-containing protein n=1 Tax=Pseudoxanthobacter sp. TaxID=1925742 RepID=UPI002FDF7974